MFFSPFPIRNASSKGNMIHDSLKLLEGTWLLKKLFGGHRPVFMPIRCNLQGTLATLGRSSCKITSGVGENGKVTPSTLQIVFTPANCSTQINSLEPWQFTWKVITGINCTTWSSICCMQYGYVSFQKQELPFKIKNKTSTIINHQISPTKKITPAQFPSISQDSPVLPTEKNPAPVVFSSFFPGFGWLVSRRCRSAPRFRTHRGSSELGHFPGGSSGQESLKQTFGTWRRLRRFPPCRCVRGKCVRLVVGWGLTKTGWFFGGRGRKMRKIWEREGLFCLFLGGDEEWKVSNQKKLYDHVPNFFVLWVVVEKWQLEQ